MKAKFFTAILFILGSLLNGCGYTFEGSGSVLPPDVKKIFIPLAENNSTQLGLGELITEALREQFESYGVVTVVDNQGAADAVLTAKILKLTRETRAVKSQVDTAVALETTVQISAQLQRVTGPILWRDPSMSVSQSYASEANTVVSTSPDFAAGSISAGDLSSLTTREVSRGQEQGVLENIAETLARQVYDQSVAPDF